MSAQFIEMQLARRGHRFYPHNPTPGLYDTDEVSAAEKIITEHYFCATGDWWICEYDPDEGQAFGYARLANMPDCTEWGYINLVELETVNGHDGLTIVERELNWEPKCFAEIDVN